MTSKLNITDPGEASRAFASTAAATARTNGIPIIIDSNLAPMTT
jgi:hypothetical protein